MATICRVTIPPGGPPFQQQYAGPPQGYPPGYGLSPGHLGQPPTGGPMAPGMGAPPGQGFGAPPGHGLGAPPGYGPGGPGGYGPGGPAGYGPGMATGYGPGAMVIDVGKDTARKAVMGSVVAGVLGLVAVVSGLVGAVDGGAVAGIVAIVIGLLFLAIPLATIGLRRKMFRHRALVFEPAGIRWDDPQGQPWAIPWGELGAVSISKHTPRQTPMDASAAIASKAAEKMVGERAHVRLDLYPADPSFAGRHPELAHLWERQGVKGGYRLPLGSSANFIPQIATAMGRFAPQIYRGVNATEGFMGLR